MVETIAKIVRHRDARRLERALRAYGRKHHALAFRYTERLWRWLNAELWFRQFVDAVPCL